LDSAKIDESIESRTKSSITMGRKRIVIFI